VPQLIQHVKPTKFAKFIKFLNVVPLGNNRKVIAQNLRLQLHIILQEQVPGAVQEIGRINTVAI
jgi:hypothetical protein